jgi:uncharacterized Zn-finger protein
VCVWVAINLELGFLVHNAFVSDIVLQFKVLNMGLKRFDQIVVVVWLISAVVIIFLLNNIDSIVHVDLYNYGLQMSTDWANPYWTYLRLSYVLLGVPMALSGIALASSFLNVKKVTDRRNVAPQRLRPQAQVAREQPQQMELKRTEAINSNSEIVCPQCGKVFGKALVMLDFHGGKNQLVSVCPYCSHVLGQANDAKCKNESFYVTTDHEKTHQ